MYALSMLHQIWPFLHFKRYWGSNVMLCDSYRLLPKQMLVGTLGKYLGLFIVGRCGQPLNRGLIRNSI